MSQAAINHSIREQLRALKLEAGRIRNATVTSASPLEVSVEGGDAIPATAIGDTPGVGDVVYVVMWGRRCAVLTGIAGGVGPQGPTGATGATGAKGDTGATGSMSSSSGSSLPGSPSDGDVYAYNADTTNGVKWMFQYRSAGASGKKWEFIGGAPLVVSDGDLRTLTNQTTYANLPTDPMSVTLPALAGDYDIEIQADLYSGTNGYAAVLSYAVGGTAANDAWAISESNTITSVSAAKRTRHTGLSSAASIAEKGRSSGSNSATFLNRRILIWPVRVG